MTANIGDSDEIPTCWPINYALSGKDALAMVSLFFFIFAPMVAALEVVGSWFGIADHVPVRDQLPGGREWLFFGAFAAGGLAASLVGKYLWLVCMSRIFSKGNIGPLISYGIPRRITRLDRTLINRLYHSSGPDMENRLRPLKSTALVCRQHGIAYGGGAVMATSFSFLPLMRGDSRLCGLAGFFAVLSVVCFGMERYTRRKRMGSDLSSLPSWDDPAQRGSWSPSEGFPKPRPAGIMGAMCRILVVDDEQEVREAVQRRLEREGYKLETAPSEEGGIEKMQTAEHAYDIVITDMSMEDSGSGIRILEGAVSRDVFTEVIVLTAYGNVANAVECMKRGAFDYVEKNMPGVDVYELLCLKVQQAVERRRAAVETVRRLEAFTKSREQYKERLDGETTQRQ